MPHAAQLSSAPAIQGLVSPVEPPTRQGLEHALSQFNQMSNQLTDSYSLLEARVSELKGELAVVSAQRMQELAEKERLANRLQNLLDLLPGGVIVIDDQGRVREANPAACDLLGLPLEGELWREVITRCFAPVKTTATKSHSRTGAGCPLRPVPWTPSPASLCYSMT